MTRRYLRPAAALASLMSMTVLAFAPAYPAEGEPQVIKVDLKEWDIGFKEVTVKGDKARFEITNIGTMPHAFELEAEIGGEKVEFAVPTLKKGEKTAFIVELPKGKYEVYCPIDGHEKKGMAAKVVFAGEE